MKICAVVVTFNRKKLLLECINALRSQTRPLEAIYIIDNSSSDGTPELLQKEGYSPSPDGGTLTIENLYNEEEIRITHLRLSRNIGGAGGFYEGVKMAYEDGYDWVWLMDDDVEPLPNTLENKNKEANSIEKKSALVPVRFFNGSHFKHDTKEYNFKNPIRNFTYGIISEDDLINEYFEVSAISFEGPLISADAIAEIGFPDKDLFIIADDTDYAIRLKKYAPIYMVSEAKMIKKVVADPEFNWKTHYLIRNIVYLDRKYGENLSTKYLRPIRTLLQYIIIYASKNPKNIKKILSAFREGYTLKKGITVAPGEF